LDGFKRHSITTIYWSNYMTNSWYSQHKRGRIAATPSFGNLKWIA
jgi:hypothetical protein